MTAHLDFRPTRLALSVAIFLGAFIIVNQQATQLGHYVGLIGGAVYYLNLGLAFIYYRTLEVTETRLRSYDIVFSVGPVVISVFAIANVVFLFLYG